MNKIVYYGIEARKKIKTGINKVANAVKVTLGPSGRNVILGRPYQFPYITNDGVSIAKEIQLDDEVEELGAQVIKQASKKADETAGDGTTTAIVLTQAIINDIFAYIDNPDRLDATTTDTMKIKREIDIAKKEIISKLEKGAKKIKTKDDMKKVAFVSSESEEISDMVVDIYSKIGKDGVVVIEDSFTGMSYSLSEGLEIEHGLLSPLFRTAEGVCEVENPVFFITNEPINDISQILPLAKVKNLIVMSDNISNDVINALVRNKIAGGSVIIPAKIPYYGDRNRMEDICVALNAKFFEKGTFKVEDLTPENLGSADKIIIKQDKTIIIGGKGNNQERIEIIKKNKPETDFDKAQQEKRIAKLSDSMAIIKVGAETEIEREYIKHKIQDTVNAVKNSLRNGVVKGGGLALYEIDCSNILSKAIKAPYNQIQENTGGIEIGDDIIDPLFTVKTAIETACSIASLVITTEVAVAIKKEEDK